MLIRSFRIAPTNATLAPIIDLRRIRPAAVIVAAFACFLASLAVTARADAYVYWTNWGTDTIGRANLDGTDVNRSFITGADDPLGVAVDAGHVYWTNTATGTIGRADLDGTGVNQRFITGADSPAASRSMPTTSTGRIGRSRARSAAPTSTAPASTRASSPASASRRASRLTAVTSTGRAAPGFTGTTIGRANLDGTGVDRAFIRGGGQGLAVDAHYLYWTDWGTGVIFRNDLDGVGSPSPFIPGHTSHRGGLAVDADHVYWTNFTTIGRANLDGTGVDQSFIGSLDVLEDSLYDAEGVAVDDLPRPPEITPPDTNPPQTKITKGAANKTDKTKVKFKFTSSEPGSTFECGLASRKFKPCASPKTIKNLNQGKHKFKVRAIDAAGNVDPTPAKDKFKVVGPG